MMKHTKKKLAQLQFPPYNQLSAAAKCTSSHKTAHKKRGYKLMPTWLQNQIKKAFYEKNTNQVKLLNQCWYYYRRKNCS